MIMSLLETHRQQLSPLSWCYILYFWYIFTVLVEVN